MESFFFDARIPEWISCRFYSVKNQNKCYISNECTHSYFEFEDLSAELLKLIYSGDKNQLSSFIKNNALEDEFEDFILEMISNGIIVSKKYPKIDKLVSNSALGYSLQDHEQTKLFEDEMYSWLGQNKFMSRLFIEMTYNCNLSCIHCYNNKNEKRIINFNEIKDAIDEAYELGIFNVTISGGECTICEDFLKIVKYIRSKHIAVDILTNGQVLYDNESLFEELVSLYPYRISLSLYSMNPEVHDSITGVKGSHNKTLAVIKKLREKNILVEIKCFLMKKNAYEYKAIQDFAKDIGVSMTLACLFFNNPERNNKDVQVTDEQLYKIYSDDNSLLKAKKIHDLSNKDFFDRGICSAGRKGVGIAPNLDIFVCSSLKILLGNLKNNSIKQIWTDTNENSPLNLLRKKRKKDLEGCFKSEHCQYCTYCPGIASFEGKYLKKCESFCRHAEIKSAVLKCVDK